MPDKIQLTNEQRITLILLHKVLAKLGSDPDYHSRAVEILENGYYEMFGDEYIGANLSEPLSYERMTYVDNVLDMYRWLQDSYKKLSPAEKAKVKKDDVIFKGFDGNNETELLVYAEFIMEKMERWSDLEIIKGLNTHHQTGHLYEAMLAAIPERSARMLTADEINKIVRSS